MSFCVSVFLFAPAHFRGLNTGTLPFAPVPNTDRSAGLEHDDSLVTPDSLNLGSSIKLAGPCLLARHSSCLRGCFCFLPSFENDQFCLDDSGTMGYFGKKALLWLARVCVSAALCTWK